MSLADRVLPFAMNGVLKVSCGAISAPALKLARPLLIEIEKRGDVCFLRFQGDFQTGEDPDYLHARMEEIEALHCAKVLADFQGVRSVGSTGLSFLVGLYRTSGGHFVLAGIEPRVREALEITRLSTVIHLADDVEQGLAALRSAN